MSVIAYIRVSTEKQDKSGLGLEDQRQKIEQYCRLRDIHDVDYIVDGDDGDSNEAVKRRRNVSASKVRFEDRPMGRKIMERIRSGAVTDLIVLKLDRLFRDNEDGIVTERALRDAGVSLHIVDLGGNTINTGSAYGEFIYVMLVASGSLEAKLAAERTKAALGVKLRNGQRVGGHATFGYELAQGPPDADGKPTVIQIPNAIEQAAVSRMVELHEKRYTLRHIAKVLEREGFVSRVGKRIGPQTVSNVLKREAAKRIEETTQRREAV